MVSMCKKYGKIDLESVKYYKTNTAVPLPTHTTSLTKRSNASHSGFSKGSTHSIPLPYQWCLVTQQPVITLVATTINVSTR
jgi:hypothetical protein